MMIKMRKKMMIRRRRRRRELEEEEKDEVDDNDDGIIPVILHYVLLYCKCNLYTSCMTLVDVSIHKYIWDNGTEDNNDSNEEEDVDESKADDTGDEANSTVFKMRKKKANTPTMQKKKSVKKSGNMALSSRINCIFRNCISRYKFVS